MRIYLAVIILLVSATTAYPQQITLEQLIRAAVEHHPLTTKVMSEGELLRVKEDGLRSVYWPDVSLNAQAGYQSMVPELPFQMPGVPKPNIPKDRYQASIDVSQLIYDGGMVNERTNMLGLESQMNQTRLMAERFPIQQQVVDAWFGLEYISVQRQTLMLTLEDLEARLKLLQVGLDEGIVMQMDVDRINAELVRLRQKDVQIQSDSTRIIDLLSEITGMRFQSSTEFVWSEEVFTSNDTINTRPELRLFDLAEEMADARVHLEDASRRPKLSGYVQGAYGKPGLDIFADNFSPFWQAGVRASWPLWDKGSSKRDREVNQLLKSQISNDRALFDRNIRIAIEHQETEVAKNYQLLVSDEHIIQLNERIKLASEAMLDEGIINATDYLHDVRSVEQARLQYESRKIAIRYALAQIKIIRGGI